MRAGTRHSLVDAVPPAALVSTGIVSVQLGAGLAARMFSQVGPAGMTGLRLWWAALIMAVLGGRGLARMLRTAIADRAWHDLAVAVTFGVVLAAMNYCIYQSFARIPLGIAVTIEFLGPLAVAVALSRRPLDIAWVILAAAGVVLLTRGGTVLARGATPGTPAMLARGATPGTPAMLARGATPGTPAMLARGATPGTPAMVARGGPLPGGIAGLGTEATGIVFGLLAASCWAAYILLSRSAGRRLPGSSGLVAAMIIAALLVTGPSVAQAGPALLRPGPIFLGLAVGLLSSVIPYWLELQALRRVPAGIFGIWMSLEPAVAALVGLILLGETLLARQWLAIVAVVVACGGAAWSGPGGRPDAAPPTG